MSTVPYSRGKYIVIDASDIADMPDPGFPWKSGSLEQYGSFIEDCQEFFRRFREGEDYSSLPNASNLEYIFVHCGLCVSVLEDDEGKYVCCSNGRHRLYAAKQYNLPILVCLLGHAAPKVDMANDEKYRISKWRRIKRMLTGR